MVKNPVLTLFLGFFPGIGHIAVGRKGRGILYLILCVMSLFMALAVGMSSREEDFLFAGMFFSFVIWAINMLDLIIYLVRSGGSTQASQSFGPQLQQPMSMGDERFYQTGIRQPVRDDASERFFTILLSFIPGLGHLQLGLMQRGMSLMIGFFGLLAMIVFVAVLADQPGFLTFLLALPIIWLYAMFDAIRLVGLKQSGEALQDRSILDDWDEHRHGGGKRSRWMATVLSILPGAGHMYLGLPNRGLQLMAGFLLSIYLLDVLQLSLFLFMVPLLWCFAFFDSLQQQSRYNNGEMLRDVPIVDWLLHRQKWLGIGLMGLGLYYIADRVVLEYLQRIMGDWLPYINLRYYFKTGLTALLLIGAGIKLLAGPGAKSGADGTGQQRADL
ncbi:hypothetical protein [Paenibacillus sp. R14(2021)]|uniref:hypothetical protein n=1 Tax=Paenibacillus sp. R14(2021) TaxID=2859228 RepID=UPI001C614773|nr:hypothetical protein [Paenibacillus sp. R14(2021)]